MIKFLANENISPLTVKMVRKEGYDIKRGSEIGLKGSNDEEIVAYAQKGERIILTFDLDFGEIYYFASKINIGILILRIKPQTVEHANEVLQQFLRAKVIETEKLQKSLVILDERKYRHRKKE